MTDKRIAQLEAQLERLVEGAFTGIFRRQVVSAHDLAIKLARSIENNLGAAQGDDARPIAPDHYTIHLHPIIQRQLLDNRPKLPLILTQHVTELVNLSGYRLLTDPLVKILADSNLQESDVTINASHSTQRKSSTAVLQTLPNEDSDDQAREPHLVINGLRRIPITEPLLNIGRSAENHIIIEGAYISRHHVQIRLRFGVYTLFDVNSRSGTFVNDVRVTQHPLRSGDVIRLGETRIVYLADDPDDDEPRHRTESIDPVD